MASISREPNGHRTLQFVSIDGKRKSIRLGKLSKKDADAIVVKVEALLSAALAKTAVDAETARWLGEIPDKLANKLARAGLTSPRQAAEPVPQLGPFLSDYIARQTHHKPNTTKTIAQAERLLTEFFGAEKAIDRITPGDAEDWQQQLRTDEYKPATIATHVKKARQMFEYAVNKKFITVNPFGKLKVPSQADKSREVFVEQETVKKVIDQCPDAEWRLIVALSRYGGLRCPSEHLALAWTDIDWAGGKFRVDSPKTGERWVPIFAELRPYLEDSFDPEAVHVISRYRDANCNLRTQFIRIIRRAGLEPWERLFHNLRSSRQTELTEVFPAHVVSAWMGNTVKVASTHYLQVTESHFERAAKSGARALQNRVQQPSATSCNDEKEMQKTLENQGFFAENAGFCEVGEYPRQESNL